MSFELVSHQREIFKTNYISSFGIATNVIQSPLMSKNGAQYMFNFDNK